MTDEQFPLIPLELLKELDRRFPERCPDPTMTEREIWLMTGRREVVRFLKAQADTQLEKTLQGSTNHVLTP